jgi:hypothetical protein
MFCHYSRTQSQFGIILTVASLKSLIKYFQRRAILCVSFAAIKILLFKLEIYKKVKDTGVFTSNNGPNNVPTQPNKHISQASRYQLIFLFFNESKTAFIKTIFSCRYVTSIMYLCLN